MSSVIFPMQAFGLKCGCGAFHMVHMPLPLQADSEGESICRCKRRLTVKWKKGEDGPGEVSVSDRLSILSPVNGLPK